MKIQVEIEVPDGDYCDTKIGYCRHLIEEQCTIFFRDIGWTWGTDTTPSVPKKCPDCKRAGTTEDTES